jgi:hypothetical protein
LAYIEGIADALASGTPIYGWRACFGDGADAARLQVVTVQFLSAHADELGKSASSLLAAAISGSFPCSEDQTSLPQAR